MNSPNSILDAATVLVIDSSAAINIVATGCGSTIIRAMPSKLVAVDMVQSELDEGRKRGRPHADLFDQLVFDDLIEIVTLDEHALQVFETLVVGPARQTLDDGEAATIAYAMLRGGTAIIDERKANRVCGERFPSLKLACTVDLFAHPNVEQMLGRQHLSQAVLNALKYAHMGVRPDRYNWVIDLIGSAQATQCGSLPQSLRMQANTEQIP